jgi:hypothetical protein
MPAQSEYFTSDEVNTREIPVVFVQMDVLGDSDKADTMKLTCMPGVPRVVPFVARPSMICLKHKYYRYQIPLAPAHCRTFHKAQGITAHNGVVVSPSTNKPFAMGLEYVAVSRAKKMADVILTSPILEHHINSHGNVRRSIAAEYRRLFRSLTVVGDGPEPDLPPCARERVYGDNLEAQEEEPWYEH